MILLNQNSENLVYLTLGEAVPTTFTSTSIYYLFRLVSQTTNEEVVFTTPNISTALTRYDQFVWTLTGSSSEQLVNGIFNAEPNGEWLYYAYAQYSPTNLFISGTTGLILERGICTITGTPVTYIEDSYSAQSTTYGYYNG